MASFAHFLGRPGSLFIDKTEYIELLDAQEYYSVLFLRPRRFGKSTFLDTLCKYYDIAERESFEGLFGGLHIGNSPTKFRSSHLVLKLDLSSIDTHGDIEDIINSFHKRINRVLKAFLKKYKCFLPEGWGPDTIDEGDATSSLENVLVSVCRFI
jgi:hypothetical protein